MATEQPQKSVDGVDGPDARDRRDRPRRLANPDDGNFVASVKSAVTALASLKLTVALFAMAIFIVLAGTFAQVNADVWEVVNDYFRLDMSKLVNTDAPWFHPGELFVWIPFKVFFPPSFFPSESFRNVWGGIYFPKGWFIGAVMAVNLLAAHSLRFKTQAKGTRLWAGLGVIGLGGFVTWAVVAAGANKEGIQEMGVDPTTLYWSLVGGMVVLWAGAVYLFLRLEREKKAEKWIVGAFGLIVGIVLCAIFSMGGDAEFSGASMRILWQLVKASLASLVLLAGCVMVFKKRAGVVLLHGGIGLMMFSELLVGVTAEEGNMVIQEGATVNYVQDIREVELAIVDASDPDEDVVVVIPGAMLQEGDRVAHADLPFDVNIDQFLKNSTMRRLTAEDDNPVDSGAGRFRIAEPVRAGTGVDTSQKADLASVYVTLFEKDDDDELGTWLFSQRLNPQAVAVDGKTYQIELRFKRVYKPYEITLLEFSKDDYAGTDTPQNYSSDVKLVDRSRGVVHEKIHIWMNNPLRYAGETFYQADFQRDPETGAETTVLQVVKNTGWMIPYVSCMIVAWGMLAHFTIILMRFLTRHRSVTYRSISAYGLMPALAFSDETSEKSEAEVPSRADDDGLWDPEEEGKPLSPLDRRKHQGRRVHPAPATAADDAGIWGVLIPVGVVLAFALFLGKYSIPPRFAADEANTAAFGKIPILYGGRPKPIDTLARNSLRIISKRETYKDGEGDTQPAILWLLDATARPDEARRDRVFYIENLELLAALDLKPRSRYTYATDEFGPQVSKLADEAEAAQEMRQRDASRLTLYQRKLLDLSQKVRRYNILRQTFEEPSINSDFPIEDVLTESKRIDSFKATNPPLVVPAPEAEHGWETYLAAGGKDWVRREAKRRDAGTVRELAEKIVAELPRHLAEARVRRLLDEIEEERARNGFAESVQETARMGSAAINFGGDHWLKTIIDAVANSDDGADEVDVVADLPDETVQKIYDLQIAAYFTQLIKIMPPETTERIAREISSAGREPSTESLTGYLVDAVEKSLETLLGKADLDGENPRFEQLRTIVTAWEKQDVDAFNTGVEAYLSELETNPPVVKKSASEQVKAETLSAAKTRFESFYNNFAPLLWTAWLYLGVFVISLVGWMFMVAPELAATRIINRTAFWLTVFLFAAHTLALAGRIYISGRPPVTNLYSSAVFIGWGGVMFGIILEALFRMGIGNVLASVCGFTTLFIAYFGLAGDGDTFTVLQAVLDTQFWLTTHVVCVTLGYATTFVAGILGMLYIFAGVGTPLLNQKMDRGLIKMIYGVLCFAIFFSFVGTVLGGLWADDSWGRFWGWDPKENGALIIVLWNALVLHARWDGMVRDRGMAVLTLVGNIVTAWSWFGTNELGVGLHSYGFTEGVLKFLLVWAGLNLLFIAAGCLPRELWISRIVEEGRNGG